MALNLTYDFCPLLISLHNVDDCEMIVVNQMFMYVWGDASYIFQELPATQELLLLFVHSCRYKGHISSISITVCHLTSFDGARAHF